MSLAALKCGLRLVLHRGGDGGLYSNINRLAILLFLLLASAQVKALSRDDFFPFGLSAGDNTIFGNDDDFSLPVCPSVTYAIYDRKTTACFVANNNGFITFPEGLKTYERTPFPLSSNDIVIAPYYGDADTRGVGELFFRETSTDSALLARADEKIGRAFASARGFSSRSLSIFTWNGVGYYQAMSDKLNTFQCVLASDGIDLYVLFLYADLEWVRGDPDDPPAQVGFNAGDHINFYSFPNSQTEDIINLNSTSNVDVPGLWIFKASGLEIVNAGCQRPSLENPIVTTTIFPAYGNQLGGALVSVQGPCFDSLSNIQCEFGERSTVGLYENNRVVHCVTPRLSRRGRVPFRLLVDGSVVGEATYTAVAIENGHQVDIDVTLSSIPLAFTNGDLLSLSWSPQAVFPQVNSDLDTFKIDIHLYTLDTTADLWTLHSTLATNILNDGSMTMQLPLSISSDIKPFVVTVATTLDPSTMFINGDLLYTKVFRSQQTVGIWTSIYYYINPNVGGINGRSLCQQWYATEPAIPPASLKEESLSCAPTREQVELPTSGFTEVDMTSVTGTTGYGNGWINTFHPRTQRCFKQSIVDLRSPDPPSEQECCYDYRGYLVTGYPGGGTINKVSPDFSRAQHFLGDVRPYFLCCTGLVPNCGNYYEKRPNDRGNRFNPPTAAWMIGDPHIITLDNLRYTFNGHGEFTLIQTPDSSFTLQGRSLPFPDPDNTPTPSGGGGGGGTPGGGTVFSALAARIGGVSGQCITITTSRRGLDIYIDEERIDMNITREHIFDDFKIISKDNSTIAVTFLNGVYLECRREPTRGLMSTIIISLPPMFLNRTKGLLGVYDGDRGNDLTPEGENTPLSVDATLREIHYDFGLSWLVSSPNDSLFVTLPYNDFTQITNTSYEPVFTITPGPSLEGLCNDDPFCLYDAVVTGDNNFGMATLATGNEVTRMETLVQPVSCDPPCSNGVCLPGNICSCPEGFEGELCQTILIEDCGGVDPNCQENEMCLKQAGSYICILDCPGNPSSSLCNPTSIPNSSTNTLTIIIAAVSVAVGLALILAFVMCVAFLCLCIKRNSGGKVDDEEHKHNNNQSNVVVDSAPSTLNRKMSDGGGHMTSNEGGHMTSNGGSHMTSRRPSRVSGTLPPSYSEIDVGKGNNNDDPILIGFHNALPSPPGVTDENDYMNIAHGQDHSNNNNNNNPPPPLPARRSSVGTIITTTQPNDNNIQHQGAQIFSLRGPPPARAQSHNTISMSPVSEDSGIHIELARTDHVTSSNVQLSPRNLSPIQEPWYRNSTASMNFHDHDRTTMNPSLPPRSPAAYLVPVSPPGFFTQTLPPHSELQPPHGHGHKQSTSSSSGNSFHRALQLSASNPGSRCDSRCDNGSGRVEVRSVASSTGHSWHQSLNSGIDEQSITEV